MFLKHLAAMQETWVQSLGQEDPLVKEMATHSSILAWKIEQPVKGMHVHPGNMECLHMCHMFWGAGDV